MLGLVNKKGFVGLTLACFALAVPAVPAKEHEKQDEQQQEAEPPGQAKKQPGTDEAPAAEPQPGPEAEPAPDADADADAEPEAESEAPPPSGRVRIRSVSGPEPTEVPADDPVPAGGSAPPERTPPRDTAPAGDPVRKPAASPRSAPPVPAPQPATDPLAGAAGPSETNPSPRADEKRAEPAEPLPVRVVPRQVREIVEVVPAGIWAALAALALLALAFAAWSWAAAMRARRLDRQRKSLLQEVGLLQTALLPAVPEGVPVSVAYRPADGATAGGDFYDAFVLSGGRTGVIIGDMSGHGREALARTTFVRYTLRAYLEAGLEPREVLKVGADALAGHLDGGFATVAVAVHDPASGRFTYANAGHPPPVVVGCEAPFEPVIACAAPPLGLGEPTGFRQSTFTLTAGARACLYTDGVTEARVGGRLLGAGRFERVLAELPPDADANALLDGIAAKADEITDDMAVCLISAGADAPAAGPRIEELEVDDEHEVGDSLERFLRACGVALADVPGILREAGEAARREGSVTVRVRANDFRPGVDVVPGNLVRLAERRRATRIG